MKNTIKKIFLTFIFMSITTNLSWSQKTKNDTTIITERKVVFYTLSQVEYDSLAKKENSEIREILSDFNYYRKLLVVDLRKLGLKSILTSDKCIEINISSRRKVLFNQKELKHIVGTILVDDTRDPKVLPGVFTSVDLLHEIKAYYKIK